MQTRASRTKQRQKSDTTAANNTSHSASRAGPLGPAAATTPGQQKRRATASQPGGWDPGSPVPAPREDLYTARDLEILTEEQDAELARLRQQVSALQEELASRPTHEDMDHLRQETEQIRKEGEQVRREYQKELASRPTHDDMDHLRREWQTSEDLFQGSQKDNEQKHATIETQRHYIKSLEAKLDDTLGPDWREDLPTPLSGSTFSSNTPLPKPGAHRQSVSLKRSSRARPMSVDLSRVEEVCETPPTNPASALLKLEGKLDTSAGAGADGSFLGSSSAGAGPLRPSGSDIVRALTPRTSASAPAAAPNAAELAELIALMQAIPASVAQRLEDKLPPSGPGGLGKMDDQKQAIIDIIDAAEERARARELNLQAMLAEAKAGSGQLGW